MRFNLYPTLGLGFLTLTLAVLAQPALAFNPAHLAQLRRTKACINCDLSFADLRGWKLAGADLTGADLTATNLRNANLSQAKLVGANLNHADLSNARLTQTDLAQASLVLTRLENAILNQANLSNAILGGSDRLSRVKSLQGATLPNGRPAVENQRGLTSL